MSTYQRLNGLSGNLQSSTSWSQRQALEQLQHNVLQALSSLSAEEKTAFLSLQRNALNALTALETAQQSLTGDFKTQGLAQLREKIGGRDPEHYTIFTRYKEKREQGFPWDPPQEKPISPMEEAGQWRARPPRAVYDFHSIDHLKHMSLWEAACLNYGFTHAIPQDSGFSQVEASYIVGPNNDRSLSTQTFISAARELDLGGQLREKTRIAMAADGPLRLLFAASAKASLLFDVIDAYRNRASSGVTRPVYDRLNAAITGTGPQLPFDTLNLSSGVTPIISVPFVPWETTLPVPLIVIRVASLGVVSYFPSRPGGAFQYHDDAQAAELAFRNQLLQSHQEKDLGWFSRQLPLIGMTVFKSLIDKQVRPEGLNWLAGHLYDGFHKAFPPKTLDNIRFHADIQSSRQVTLVHACTYRQIQRFQADLDTLGQTRSEKDWQALKDAAAAIAGEVLQLLLTPVPGGVTGMNRAMQLMAMGSLTYSVAQGVNELAKNDASGFASALADVADLAVTGRLISTAGRVHRRRMHAYLEKLGNPRNVTRADGSQLLWKPDALPYAHENQRRVDGLIANAMGLYTHKDQHFAKVRQGELNVLVEVTYEALQKRHVIKTGKDRYTPPIIFEPTVQAWTFDLTVAHTLSNLELVQRMLPNGPSTLPLADLDHMLRSTATTRTTLDNVWRAQPAPLNLIEGVRRLQVDGVIQQIIDTFVLPGQLPSHADSSVFCLLTQLNDWPTDTVLHVYDAQGVRLETYGKTEQPPPRPHAIHLKRLDNGRYTAHDALATGPLGEEHLLQLIIRRQPLASTLGKEARPNVTEAERIGSVRQQVAALASSERHALFSALFSYWGYEKGDLSAAPAARKFLPVKASPPLVDVTPLLKKLRDLNPPLTAANLDLILAGQPLTARQQQAFLNAGTLPKAFVEALDHHRNALRIDSVIDGLYNPRDFNADTDQWAREFAGALIRNTLKRPFVVSDIAAGHLYVPSSPSDLTVNLRLYPGGDYRAYDIRNASEIVVSPIQDSFYLAIAAVLQPHERQQLGINSPGDAKGLRNTLGDQMSARRSPEGFVSLLNGSLEQYGHNLALSPDLIPRANGIYDIEGQQYLPLSGALCRIIYDQRLFKWRLKHPEKIGVDTPILAHNGQGAWRLASENPMTWDSHQLLRRLGHRDYAFTQQQATDILALTDTSDRALRQVHRAGHAAPPLLADTCKRFKIEQQIQHFIDALRVDPKTRDARADLQLLVVSGLPGWPDSHSLQIVDKNNRVLIQYPSTQGTRAQHVIVTEQNYNQGNLLNELTRHDPVISALLGKLPASPDERLFELVKKVIEFAQKEKGQLFHSIYQRHEKGTEGVTHKHFKAKHPGLPNTAIDAILGHATPKELKQLHQHGKVSLRLAEHATLTTHDVRLNRAYEGLYLEGLINPDTDKIILHLLKSVPGWPADSRIEVREGHFNGPSIESAGNLSGADRKVLVKTHQTYQAYDTQGNALARPVDAGSNLLPAIVLTLSAAQRTALGITDEVGTWALREQIARLALSQRVHIKSLLDLPHLQPWLRPAMNVDRTFLAYPLWTDWWPFGVNRPPDLISRAQELYPRMNNDDARQLIRSLQLSDPAALVELDRRQAEYHAMDIELTRWSDTPQDIDDEATDPIGLNLGLRRYIANQLRQAWRRDEARQVYINGLFHVYSLSLQLDNNDLPPASFLDGLSGFSHIENLHIAGNAFPASGNAFLSKFSALKCLSIDCGLTDLPPSITQMTELLQLNLSGNNIVLTQESAQRLAAMSHLRRLNLDDNPLGMTPDVSRMSSLSILELSGTGISQWPVGVNALHTLLELHLQENRITSIPEHVFMHREGQLLNRNTWLHDNPLSLQTRQRLDRYRVDTGVVLGGELPAILLLSAQERRVITPWLEALPSSKHPYATELWGKLLSEEGASPDDFFSVLGDLTLTLEYTQDLASQRAMTARVWTLIEALSNSADLRNEVFLNTYVAGTCGDGAILVFSNMELRHTIHQTLSRYNEHEIDRQLLKLAKQVHYLERLDQFSDALIERLNQENKSPDAAEITLFFRVTFVQEFNLPVRRDQMLYSPGSHVTNVEVNAARQMLRALEEPAPLMASYLERDFWLKYLALRYPQRFMTIDDTFYYASEALKQASPDRLSDEYLENLQKLVDQKISGRNDLIRQLTEAAVQAAGQA